MLCQIQSIEFGTAYAFTETLAPGQVYNYRFATRELKQARVPGSKWAVSGGCGTTIEGEPRNMMVACGMGHVPVKSRRFLHFFTKGESL